MCGTHLTPNINLLKAQYYTKQREMCEFILENREYLRSRVEWSLSAKFSSNSVLEFIITLYIFCSLLISRVAEKTPQWGEIAIIPDKITSRCLLNRARGELRENFKAFWEFLNFTEFHSACSFFNQNKHRSERFIINEQIEEKLSDHCKML